MSFGRLLFGALLVGIGGVLLASQFGYLPAGVMPWFLQYWPALVVLLGLMLLANAMKSAALGWFVALLAIVGMGFGAWWLANHRGEAATAHTTTHSLSNPLVQSVSIRTRTMLGRVALAATTIATPAPADLPSHMRANALEVTVSGVSEKSARHLWSTGGRTAELVWPAHSLIPNTAPLGADIRIHAPERTTVRLHTETILSGADLDLTRLRPEGTLNLSVTSGAARLHLGSSLPSQINVRGVLGGAEIDLPPSGPVRVEFLSPLTARSLPDDFMENVGGRGKAKIWMSEGKGTPLLIRVDGVALYVKIKRAPQRAGG